MAKGHEYFHIGGASVSPDGKLLAYAEDDVGRRQYTLRIKNLETGAQLADAVANVEADFVWAADNKTLLYVVKDPVTLLSVRVHKHQLGTDPNTKDSNGNGIPDGTDFYFVHSYAFAPQNNADVLATTDYGVPVTAAVRRGHVWGTQFHPEKSSRAGFRLLKNFIEGAPC